jgi:hypothetical protein
MNMHIPTIGEKFELTADWNFTLYAEHRNKGACKYFELECERWWDRGALKTKPVMLPKGTILTVDRIYIRKGVKDYDSVSFYVNFPKIAGEKKRKGFRFWAKLPEVNAIECEWIQS